MSEKKRLAVLKGHYCQHDIEQEIMLGRGFSHSYMTGADLPFIRKISAEILKKRKEAG